MKNGGYCKMHENCDDCELSIETDADMAGAICRRTYSDADEKKYACKLISESLTFALWKANDVQKALKNNVCGMRRRRAFPKER
jgi:hypothetical protein